MKNSTQFRETCYRAYAFFYNTLLLFIHIMISLLNAPKHLTQMQQRLAHTHTHSFMHQTMQFSLNYRRNKNQNMQFMRI